MGHNLKIVESTLTGPRDELRGAILDCEHAEAAAKKAQAEVDRTSDRLREKERARASAMSALDEAQASSEDAC
jgi:hypothetical protein